MRGSARKLHVGGAENVAGCPSRGSRVVPFHLNRAGVEGKVVVGACCVSDAHGEIAVHIHRPRDRGGLGVGAGVVVCAREGRVVQPLIAEVKSAGVSAICTALHVNGASIVVERGGRC